MEVNVELLRKGNINVNKNFSRENEKKILKRLDEKHRKYLHLSNGFNAASIKINLLDKNKLYKKNIIYN